MIRRLPLCLILTLLASALHGIDLTPEETEWLSEHKVITLAVDDGNPPANYRNTAGTMTGLGIDVINLVAEKTGVEIQYFGSDWPTAYEAAVSWEVDGIINANYSEERLEYFNFTDPYFDNPMAFAVGPDVPDVENLLDMARWKVGVIENTVRVPLLKELVESAEIVEVRNLEDGFKMLVEGKIDAFFDDLTVVSYQLGSLVSSGLRVGFLYYAGTLGESRIAIRKDEPLLVSIINKGIASIEAHELGEIQRRWLTEIQNVRSARKLELTDEETAWLAAHPKIRFYADPGYAPYNYAEDGTIKGLSVDIAREVGRILGIDVELIYDRPWAQGLEALKNNEVDVTLTTVPVAEREAFMNFTAPYVKTSHVIFSQADRPYVTDLHRVSDTRVPVSPGTATETLIRDQYPNLERVYVKNPKEAVDRLVRGEVDLIVDNVLVIGHYMRQAKVTTIKVSGELDTEIVHGFGVRKDWPELVSILDKALASIPPSRTDEITESWSRIQYIRRIHWRELIPWFLMVFVIIGVVVLWIIRLSKEIQRRKIAEEDLRFNQEILVRSERLSAVGELVVGLSHEFNTPLGICITSASYLKGQLEELLEEKDAQDPSMKREALVDLVSLVNLLTQNLSKTTSLVTSLKILESDDEPATTRVIEVYRHISDILRIYEPKLESASCRMTLSCPKDLLVKTYPSVFLQILDNLIKNSLEHGFSNSQEPSHNIMLEVQGNSELVALNYSDNGIGVTEEQLLHLFDPFFTTKRNTGKTGLGLNRVYRIVTDLLKGEIIAYRPPHGGLGLKITIPGD